MSGSNDLLYAVRKRWNHFLKPMARKYLHLLIPRDQRPIATIDSRKIRNKATRSGRPKATESDNSELLKHCLP